MTLNVTILPSVSVVVMNYNYGRYVGDALASAIGQEPGDYRLAEVVVIDDGSTDNSNDVYRRFPAARVLRKAHEGFAATLTRAVSEASGEWLAVLDADDVFRPDKLRRLARHLANPDLLVIQHAEYVIDAEGRSFAEGTHPGGSTSTLVVRTSAARDLLPVTNELFFHVFADAGRGIRLPDLLAYYRVHDASMTDRRTPGRWSIYLASVCKEVATRLDALGTHPPMWAHSDLLTEIAVRYRLRADDYQLDAQCKRSAHPGIDGSVH